MKIYTKNTKRILILSLIISTVFFSIFKIYKNINEVSSENIIHVNHVNFEPNKKIIACGNTIGVKLKIDGVMIVDISEVINLNGIKQYPLKRTGIKIGDIITEVNGERIDSISTFSNLIKSSRGNLIELTIKRDEKIFKKNLKAVRAYEDKNYHLGIWVRDSMAGIGTLTFYEPESGYFGALGHAISDIDTGDIVLNSRGEILKSSILTVKRGKIGSPGELKGMFALGEGKIGEIFKNTEEGIYGVINQDAISYLNNVKYEICQRDNIHLGRATILANVRGLENKEYDIEISKIYKRGNRRGKGMSIKVTDHKLLELTGGIVQGMSGCPILQNGRIIGAVTHVFVNDPTKGYGIFIEDMLKNIAS